MTDPFPDSEGDLRTWLRALSSVTAVVAQRTFFAVPDDATDDDYPLLLVQRVGGGEDTSDAAIDAPLLQVTVVGTRRGKQVAADLANTIRSEIRATRWTPTTWGTSTLLGATVESVIPSIDPSDGRPRYAVTIQAFLHAAGA